MELHGNKALSCCHKEAVTETERQSLLVFLGDQLQGSLAGLGVLALQQVLQVQQALGHPKTHTY